MVRAPHLKPKEWIDGVRSLVRLSRVAQWECERTGITLPQYRALLNVSLGTRRASELADFAAVSRPAVTALVNGLVELGLLRRKAVPADGRGVHLVATAKGRRAVARAESAMVTRLTGILGDRPETRAMLRELSGLEGALDEDLVRDVLGRRTAEKSSKPAKSPRRRKARP